VKEQLDRMEKDTEQTAQPRPAKQTKKQRRKAAQRRQLLTVLVIVILVAAVAGFFWWFQNRPEKHPDPHDLRITAVVNGQETEVAPYSVCAIGQDDCTPGTPTKLDIPADGEVTLKLPDDVSDGEWQLLQIYDDPGANVDNTYSANEKSEVTIKGSSDQKSSDGKNPRLAVAEIHTWALGQDDDGEQGYTVVWSVAAE
jgi:cytoskeletal protein RodZ